MKTYQIHLTAKGLLTQLPDSQKLFGALVYLFSSTYGSENATKFVRSVFQKEIHFMLSNVLPAGYLPTPKEFFMDHLLKSSSTEEGLKQMYSAIKERDYIRPSDLQRVMANINYSKKHKKECGKEFTEIYPYVKVQIQQQQRASIESLKYDIPVLESKLYSVPTASILEINSNSEDPPKEESRFIKNYYFFLQIDESDMNDQLIKMLQEAIEQHELFILGKRASQGLNTFTLCSILDQQFADSDTEYCLNTGMLLPDKINFTHSYLKLFTSERRPFEMAGGWDQHYTQYYISFIAEGSMIYMNGSDTGSTGKSIRSVFNKQREDIVFGNSFLFPINTKLERQVAK